MKSWGKRAGDGGEGGGKKDVIVLTVCLYFSLFVCLFYDCLFVFSFFLSFFLSIFLSIQFVFFFLCFSFHISFILSLVLSFSLSSLLNATCIPPLLQTFSCNKTNVSIVQFILFLRCLYSISQHNLTGWHKTLCVNPILTPFWNGSIL